MALNTRAWTPIVAEASADNGSHDQPGRQRARFRLDQQNAEAALGRAPGEGDDGRIRHGLEWSVPMPSGEFRTFLIVESPLMAPELAARYPRIKTYRGVGVEDPRESLRLDLHRGQLHAQVLSAQGAAYIDPDAADPGVYESYYATTAALGASLPFECQTLATAEASAQAASTVGGQSDGMLRVYRLAVSATGEYTQFHGGTVEAGLAAIVTALNRVNGIYESELAIRFQLVANNDLLVFTDPSTDPYSNGDAAAMLSQNQFVVDSVIGPLNYDVGHVFATGGGGLAQLDSVCVSGWKARGVTGRGTPTGDAFYIGYVAHELGHQFGARHSFNGVSGECSQVNRHAQTAFEPGSGSTIMGYSGICGSDNIQYGSDPYFHSANLLEIHNFISASCVPGSDLGNSSPAVSAGLDYTIPMGTPFRLTALGEDLDGDVLSYCWEQIDLGPAAPLDGLDHGAGPLFRSFPPDPEPVRTFPSLIKLVQNVASSAEVLPVTPRTLNFRVTARDNAAGGGAFSMDSLQLTVVTNAGPFSVLYPNTASEVAGSTTVAWDVAGTDAAPISCESVDILLSTDGGYSYPIVLAEGVVNNGTATVTFPEIYCNSARLQVRGNDNVFFDISDDDFTIVPSAMVVVVETNTFANTTSLLIPASGTKGNASQYPSEITVSNVAGSVEALEVRLSGLTHTYVDDLDVLLVGPAGQSVILLSDVGGGAFAGGVDLTFSDEGEPMPEVGTIPSGRYQPLNLGLAGDTFPLPGPHGTALSVFNGIDPNGVWALYVIDDSSGDSGLLAGGWSLAIRTSRVQQPTNQAPVIVVPPGQYVHAGTSLVVTNQAVDPDGSGSLTFALRPDAPAGAQMDNDGVLTWTPSVQLIGTTRVCGVTVTDSGTPRLSAEAEFEVVVVGPPVITTIQVSNDVARLEWTSVPNKRYRVECTTDLAAPIWEVAGQIVPASGLTTTTTCLANDAAQRFFRVRVEP